MMQHPTLARRPVPRSRHGPAGQRRRAGRRSRDGSARSDRARASGRPAVPAVRRSGGPAGVGPASADVVRAPIRAPFRPDTRGGTGKPTAAPVWRVRDVSGGRAERGSDTIHGRAAFKRPALAPYQSSGGRLAGTERRAGWIVAGRLRGHGSRDCAATARVTARPRLAYPSPDIGLGT